MILPPTVGTLIVSLERGALGGNIVTREAHCGSFMCGRWYYQVWRHNETFRFAGENFGVRVSTNFETLENR